MAAITKRHLHETLQGHGSQFTRAFALFEIDENCVAVGAVPRKDPLIGAAYYLVDLSCRIILSM